MARSVDRKMAALAAALALLGTAWPALAQTVTVYVAFGDSITEGNVGDDPGRTELGYPPRLEALLAAAGTSAEVRNRGKGGEKTYEGVTRIDDVLDEGGAQVLILMEGTNDISQRQSIESILANLSEMARKAEDRGLSVLHATVIPRFPEARVDAMNLVTAELNQGIRNLAGTRGRDLGDPFEVFGQEDLLFDRFYDPFVQEDPVGHPNGEGYDLLAELFADVLTDQDEVPPVVGALEPANREREVSPNQVVEMEFWDFGRGIDLGASQLLINGAPVGATATGDSRRGVLRYVSPTAWNGVVRVGLRSRDTASPANTVDREMGRFVVAGTAILAGDLDEDGRVDGADLLIFARAFGAGRNNRRYVAAADTNDDGSIDGVDLAQLAANFGRSSF